MPNDLSQLLKEHLAARPTAQITDAVKFIFQNEFGGGHLIGDREAVFSRLLDEMSSLDVTNDPLYDDLGNGLVRLNLYPASGLFSAETIFRMFEYSVRKIYGSRERFEEKLRILYDFDFPEEELSEYLEKYKAAGYPAASHSERYRSAYAPHYRVVLKEFVEFAQLFSAIDKRSRFTGPLVLGIDGMCASGKSSLGRLLGEIYDANLFHADDYFLPQDMRTPERLSEPGGNMHRERLLEEILLPLSRNEPVTARRFDCAKLELMPPVLYPKKRINIIEGSYSLHPELREFYTIKIALRTEGETQIKRITARDPELMDMFLSRWIPMENRYFEIFRIFVSADIIFET